MRKRLGKWLFTLALAATLTVSANGVTAYAAEVPEATETETVTETTETVEVTETEDTAKALAEADQLAAPTGLHVTEKEHVLKLDWYAVEGAEGYMIQECEAPSGSEEPAVIGNAIEVNTTTYTFNGLDGDVTHYYYVYAYKKDAGNQKVYGVRSDIASGAATKIVPADVTNLTATEDYYGVTLQWDVVPDATSYRIYDASNGQEMDNVTVNSYSQTGITTQTKTWSVRAVREANGKEEISANAVECRFTPKEIGSVTDLQVINGDGTSTLKWSAVPGATSYLIQSDLGLRTFVDTCTYEVQEPELFYMKTIYVSAVWTGGGKSYYSEAAEAKPEPTRIVPSKVTGVKATGLENAVKLTWSATKNTDCYYIFSYDASKKSYKKIAETKSTSYTIKNQKAGSYTYAIKAVHKASNYTAAGDYSANVTAKVTQVVPAKVTGLKGKAQENAVKLTWTASKNATQYKIYMYDKNGKKTVVATTKNTSYTVKGLEATKTQFNVLAQRVVNGRTVDASAKSSKVSVTPTTKTPGKVKDLTAAIGSGKVVLSWSKATNATGYNIYKYDSSKKNYVKIGTTKSNTYTVTGLKNGTEYRFKVRAYRNVNSLVKSGEMTSAVRATPGKVTNGWNTVDGNRYYYKNGKALTGKQTISGNVYYFNKSGVMQMGWVYYDGYKFYHSKATGKRMTDVTKFLTSSQKKSYQIKVNKKMNTVTVYAKDGSKGYIIPVKAFICSTGTTTPVGTFKIYSQVRWAEMMGPSWGQWVSKFYGGYWFHSVFYNSYNNNNDLSVSAYNKLGTTCSHGCIRMTAADVKWIYDNTNTGATVVIYNSSTSGPFGKPSAVKLPSWHTWDPTDPNMAYKCKAKGCH